MSIITFGVPIGCFKQGRLDWVCQFQATVHLSVALTQLCVTASSKFVNYKDPWTQPVCVCLFVCVYV